MDVTCSFSRFAKSKNPTGLLKVITSLIFGAYGKLQVKNIHTFNTYYFYSKHFQYTEICEEPSLTKGFNCTKRDKFTVVVEGNIGCGKSTFLSYFDGSSPNLEILEEPVKQWQNLHGHNLLEKLYTDPQRWSAAFQSYVQLTMLQNHCYEQTHPVKLLERSLYSARIMFIENLYKTGNMSALDYNILDEWYNWAKELPSSRVDLIVYLQASPETCLERIKKRARYEEVGIPLELLQQFHELHENWLIHNVHGEQVAPVLVIDAECSVDELHKVYESHRTDILCGYE